MILASGCAHQPPQAPSALTPDEHARLGASYGAKGLEVLAAQEYRAALAINTNCAPAWVGLGNLAFDRAQYKQAEKHYRKAIRSDPMHPSANNNLAMIVLLKGGSLDAALELALRGLRHSGRLRPYVLDTLAQIYMRQGRYPLAKAALDEAEQNAPPDDRFRERLLYSRRSLEALSRPSVFFPFL